MKEFALLIGGDCAVHIHGDWENPAQVIDWLQKERREHGRYVEVPNANGMPTIVNTDKVAAIMEATIGER